ncbi:hypothetical protein N7447_005230 [Penicillium robsamsonii]|uniref:uncharacterized protein n=1 Tax=Penicillium robsamsonii TaxID=1792511 RepID=UPI0025480AFD|nr:uncharacterized protein N7447_005230 [Penicillium robsamsonii]KAJ5822890.1 hypothetical protein N7447_005230 [Penicillium robsamsonii]
MELRPRVVTIDVTHEPSRLVQSKGAKNIETRPKARADSFYGGQNRLPPGHPLAPKERERERERDRSHWLEEQFDWLSKETQITGQNFLGPWAANWDIRWAEIGHYWRLSGWRILGLVITAQLAIERLLTPRSTE